MVLISFSDVGYEYNKSRTIFSIRLVKGLVHIEKM